MPITLAIVDDKSINRQTVKDKIASYKEVELIMEARNGKEFLQQLAHSQRHPQVVLMDLEMPEMNGIETIRQASAAWPDIRFIVLTVFEDTDKIFEAIKAGAGGYLLKEDSAVNIIDAIVNVVEYNGIPMSPAIARKAMDMLRQMPVQPEAEEETGMDNHSLSDREMEILKELVSGKNYKAIGEKLFISPLTVRKHVAHIYGKLHVNSRAQVINIAHKNKWI
ncbi:MAG TPA: response regulator transcription factor [Chitinophagaceae bacterium]|nr:response regulator transcription factor [Chitinophagaceae bacterium]